MQGVKRVLVANLCEEIRLVNDYAVPFNIKTKVAEDEARDPHLGRGSLLSNYRINVRHF